jgi:hypothetical protein
MHDIDSISVRVGKILVAQIQLSELLHSRIAGT